MDSYTICPNPKDVHTHEQSEFRSNQTTLKSPTAASILLREKKRINNMRNTMHNRHDDYGVLNCVLNVNQLDFVTMIGDFDRLLLFQKAVKFGNHYRCHYSKQVDS